MYCGFGVQLEAKETNRYQRLKMTHPIHYDYLVTNFGSLLIEFEVAFQ